PATTTSGATRTLGSFDTVVWNFSHRLRGLPAAPPGVSWPFSTTTAGARVTWATTTSPPPAPASETAARNASVAAGEKSVGTRIFLNAGTGSPLRTGPGEIARFRLR